jgi:hypothetical protein
MSSTHTQEISLGSTRKALELTRPKPPLLVLFLKQSDTAQLSFPVIELDERMKIEPSGCDCRSTKNKCAVSILERAGTALQARRFYARNGLNSWNLATIGEHWPLNRSDAIRVQEMYWIRLEFRDESECKKFGENVANLVRIFTVRMDDYQKDLKLIRGTHSITQSA